MKAATIIFFYAVSFCCADTLRISKVADHASDGTERITLSGKDTEEVLSVKKVSVIGDADVKQAVPNYGLDNTFYVELTDNGARKLRETTEKMIYGKDRLAIIVDGRLVFAPVVQEPLGGEFVISGLEDRGPREIDDLARKMSGRPPRPEGVESAASSRHPAGGEKGVGRQPPVLKVMYPQMDPTAKDFDIITFVEGIKILNPKAEVNIRDLGGLISTCMTLEKALRANVQSELTVSSNCDFVDMLAHTFVEVATLTGKATNGRILIKSLNGAMLPYINGNKTWPIKSK